MCLSTGFLSDGEPTRPFLDPKVGVEGANNGKGVDPANDGEVSKELWPTAFGDEDFHAVHVALPVGGDPAVLEFNIDLHSPGFLRLSFVFASDEFPAFIEAQFNDSIAIFVKGPCAPAGSRGENIATFVRNGVVQPFTLQVLSGCPLIFLKNQMSPKALDESPGSEHKIKPPYGPEGYYIFYDHEFGGFSTVLTRETTTALAPGRYKIKIAMEDVADRKVDSALFIPSGGLKLFALNPGDYTGDGIVDGRDFTRWDRNFEQDADTFYEADGNGDCYTDEADYDIWLMHVGETGNADLKADFNRSGCVDGADNSIRNSFAGLTECASRFEGDADRDGDVDQADFNIWQSQQGKGNCSGGNAAMTAGGGSPDFATIKSRLPKSADMDGDGDVDKDDLPLLRKAVTSAFKGSATPESEASESEAATTNQPANTAPLPDGSVPEPELADAPMGN